MSAYPFGSALITGASSGIGEAMAHLLGEAGVSMVVVARRRDRLDDLARRYRHVEVLDADLATGRGLALVEARLTLPERPIDLMINNAGFGTTGDFHTLDPDRMVDEIALNITALTRLSRAALGVMIPRGYGYLLNVSSVASFQPAPRLAVYAATKAYVTSLTESLHEEVRGTGVHVTALCPGLTRTEFQSVSSGAQTTRYPAAAWTSAEKVARTGLEDVAAGRALSVPGALYKGLVVARGVVPRSLARRMSSLVQRGD
jgi:short-subunit dehydrogenase